MKEISHEIHEASPVSTVLSMGLTRMLGMESDTHEVVVEHDGEYRTGRGESHAEAKDDAVRKFGDDDDDD